MRTQVTFHMDKAGRRTIASLTILTLTFALQLRINRRASTSSSLSTSPGGWIINQGVQLKRGSICCLNDISFVFSSDTQLRRKETTKSKSTHILLDTYPARSTPHYCINHAWTDITGTVKFPIHILAQSSPPSPPQPSPSVSP